MAGYSGTPLPRKLGIKENQRIAMVNEPESFQKQLGALPTNAHVVSKLTAPLDLVVLFVESERDLASQFPSIAK